MKSANISPGNQNGQALHSVSPSLKTMAMILIQSKRMVE